MSIKFYDKSQSTPQEVLLAGTPQTDQILNPSSKNAIANKTVYNALSEKVSKTVNDLVNYYTKSDVYNKQEIRELIGAIETLTMEVVNALPSSDISTTTIYLLKQTGSSNYDEYVYINNEWVKIGTTQIDLSGYVTTSQLNQAIADFLTETEINLLLSAKQDKNLSSSVTIGSETVGTVEDAISEVADVIPSTVSASNKLATQGDIVNIEIDDSLSSTSENPVQNKVLKSALDDKQPKTLSSPIGGETTVEGVLNATDAALSNYINFAGAKNMLPCFLGNRLQYGIDFTLNDNGSITMNGTSTGNPAYYAFAGENNGTANSPLLYKLTEVGLSKFLSFKVKITDTAITGVNLRIYFYDSTGTIIPNPNTSTNYINCSTSVTIDFNTGYYSNAEYVAFMLTVSKDTVLVDATVYPLIYELNEYTRNSAYFPWAMTNRDLTTDVLKHTSWTDISKVGAVNFLENNAVTTVDSTAGLTYTVNADKSVTVSATSGTYPFTVLANSNLVLYEADGSESYVGKQIKISGCPKGGSDAYHIQAYRANSVDGSTGTIKEYGNGVIFDWLNDGSGIKAKVSVVLRKDLEMEGPLEFYPMITLTNYQGDYVSYAKTNNELTANTIGLLDNVNKNGAKNLLPFDLNELKRLNTSGTWNGTSYTNNGVTFVINSDNTISTSGTSSARFGFTIYLDYDARNMIMSGCPQGGARATYSLQYSNYSDQSFADIGNGYTIPSAINTGTWRVVIWIEAGAVLDNLTFKPMLRLASDIDSTYQPYAMTNQQMTSKLIGLADNVNKNGSKNLLRITKATSTVYGVTFTVYDDGHIRVNGTANNPNDTGCNFVFSYVNTEHEIPKGRYTLSCDGLPHSNTFQCVIDAADSSYQYVKRIAYIASASLTTFDVDYNGYACFYAFLHVGNGTTVNNVDVYPMLRLASDPDDTHVPFAMTNRELTKKLTTHTVLTNSVSDVTVNTTSSKVCPVTLTPGLWNVNIVVQGKAAITSNAMRCECKLGSYANSSLPHNTPYPAITISDVMEVTTDTVVGLDAYFDTAYELYAVKTRAIKIS